MGRTQQEVDVRRLYAGIVVQAITDINSPEKLNTWREVQRFLKSEWGQHVCSIAGVSADKIEEEYCLCEKIKMEKGIRATIYASQQLLDELKHRLKKAKDADDKEQKSVIKAKIKAETEKINDDLHNKYGLTRMVASRFRRELLGI